MDYCVCCGAYVPEGTMVCSSCWKRYMENEDDKVERWKHTRTEGTGDDLRKLI